MLYVFLRIDINIYRSGAGFNALIETAEREIVFGSLSVFIIEFDGLIHFFCYSI